MKQINCILVGVIVVFIAAIVLVNAAIMFLNDSGDKPYNIEINRAYLEIEDEGYGGDVDLTSYQYVKDITYLPNNASLEEIDAFYQEGNTYITIKPIDENGEIAGYVKFTYDSPGAENLQMIQITVSIFLLIMGGVITGILIYIKKAIIKPFNEIEDMPFELSKGHLTKNLKESKNKYFGRFLWGLDLLRENLEERKEKELLLEKEKKTLILSISHDIKTPLSAINLYTKALRDNLYKGEAKRDHILFEIDEKTEEIEDFIKDIVKASKEDFLNIEVLNRDFYLKDVMDSIEDYYKDKMQLLKIDFHIDHYENCLLYGDPVRLQEAIENVIENGIKYGDGRKISIHVTKEEDYQLITITNSGNTLSKRELIHVFDSFYRGSNIKGEKGSGLGLYIARTILRKMNGEIYGEVKEDDISITLVVKMKQ